jgi:hypothetical protein
MTSPATPAPPPAAPAAAPEPQTHHQSPIEAALAAARANLEAGRPLIPTPTSAPAPAPAAEAPPPEAEAPPAPEAEKPPEGEEAPPPPPEGEEAPPEGEETPEEAPSPDLVVELPGRRPGDDPFEIVVDDVQTAERLRQMVNSAMRRDQYNEAMAEVERSQAELRAVEEQITLDPAGFILDHLPEDTQIEVAMSILTKSDIWERLQADVTAFDDPDRLELARARLESQRYKKREERKALNEETKAAQKNATEIKRALTKLVPANLTEEQEELFLQDALQAVQKHVLRTNVRRLEVADLPLVLAARLRAYGVDPTSAAAKLAEDTAPENEGRDSQVPQSAQNRQRAKAQMTGKQFRDAQEKKKAVAAMTPPSASTPAGIRTPPPGQNLQQRMEWAKQHGMTTR